RVLTVSLYAAVFLPLTLGLLLHITYVWWVPVGLLVGSTFIVALNAATAVRHLVRCTLMHSRLAWLVGFLAATSTLLRQHPWHLLGNIVLTLLRCVMAGVVVQLALWAAGEWQPFLPVLLSIKIWQRTTPVKVWVNAILTGSLRACSPQEKCKLP